MISLKVLNPEEELLAFPLNQSIKLLSNVNLEDTNLKTKIVLIRSQKDVGVFNSSDFYNQNIGYIKERYSSVPMNIVSKVSGDNYEILCDPVEPLSPASDYILFIDKDISEEAIHIAKTVNKGPSDLSIVSILDYTVSTETEYKLKVTSSPTVTSTSNVVKFQLYINKQPSQNFIVNTKSDKLTFSFNGITIQAKDAPFALGEEFKLSLKPSLNRLPENLVLILKTVPSLTIKPVGSVAPSHSISNQDILDYYKNLDEIKDKDVTSGINFSNKNWQDEEVRLEYVDEDKFIIHLKTLTADKLALENLDITELPAYNRSDLKSIGLYNKEEKYKIEYTVLDDTTILFELVKA